MPSGSRRSKDSKGREKSAEMPPPKKKKFVEGDEDGDREGTECPQMTLRELSDIIYTREDLCLQEVHVKKKWYLRDARIADDEGIFEQPCLWLEVSQGSKKEPL